MTARSWQAGRQDNGVSKAFCLAYGVGSWVDLFAWMVIVVVIVMFSEDFF